MNKAKAPPHIIIFTGHMLDAPGRKVPRFPAASEDPARKMIRHAVEKAATAMSASKKELIGISGGASGGDILFQEVCNAMEIPSKMYLALPKDKYITASVAPAGAIWVRRFHDLYKQNEVEILVEGEELAGSLRDKDQYSIWERSNLWMLGKAMATSKNDFTLIALWNGESGDGPGGTKDMVARALAEGAEFIHLDARLLLK